MSWRLVVSGNKTVLRKLADSSAHPHWRVVEDKGEFLLESPEIQHAQSFEAVEEIVQSVLQQINGSLVLANIGHGPLTADIQQIGPNGKRTLFLKGEITARSSLSAVLTVIGPDGTIQKGESPGDLIWRTLSKGEAHKEVSRALRLLTKGSDLFNLYRVYEIIREDAGGEKEIAARGWAPRKQLVLFRRSAQLERHGVSRGQPPSEPMTLKNARRLVHGLCRRWVASKQQ